MKVLIIAPYPINEAPSQRFRFEQYLSFLELKGIQFSFAPFWGMHTWKILYQSGKTLEKTFGLLAAFFRRMVLMFTIGQYDFVWIHREAAPVGPPVFEWLIAKLWRKKIIYDYDDAIWQSNVSAVNSFADKLKWYSKVKSICKWSWKVSAGNDYLCNYARMHRKADDNTVIYIPTTIDTNDFVAEKKINNRLVVGWTGSQSTVAYLRMIIEPLQQLQSEYEFDMVVISNLDAQMPLKNYRFVKWQAATEAKDLSQIDIGLMPLPDEEWTKGKCGFKLLQYMAVGIPSVASPVGVNPSILDHEQAGLLANNPDEWKTQLRKLLSDETLRKKLGTHGKQHLQKYFSVQSQLEVYARLFKIN
mgnify:CR=1 FL=1